jgi:hypothetical protein
MLISNPIPKRIMLLTVKDILKYAIKQIDYTVDSDSLTTSIRLPFST